MSTTLPQFDVPESLRLYRREVTAGGLRFHLYDAGRGPAWVLLHGLADEADSWRHVIPALAQTHRVIAPDLPGFGRTERPQRAYTPGFFVRAVAALLEELGLGEVALVGNSLGAEIAARLALERPRLVNRLVLVDGPSLGGGVSPALLRMLVPGLGERYYTRLRASQDEAYATLRPYYADLEALPPEDRAFLRERVWARVWSDGQRRAFFSTLRQAALASLTGGSRFREALKHLQVPTLIVWGEKDYIVPVAAGQALAALIPKAKLQVIPSCGHLPQQEKPEELVRLLLLPALLRREPLQPTFDLPDQV